ncbi:Family S53 protease-like protein [Mycena venus]|uniref:Family S53 protease-like protein n=1 Tax=Mycena venus TaxID=2733690 RepID=A0A8H6X837_9AGAR|nr:Family S53 protease-like protein [Mycena venus]
MAFRKFLAVLSIAIGVSGSSMVLHERRTAVPSGFVRQGAAPGNEMITLRVALTSNNVSGLEQKLKSIASPGSPDFRQWLSKDEVKAFVQPSSETVSAFNAFAFANGLTTTLASPHGDWVSITLPVAQANKLFAAQFDVFTHPSLEAPITRTLSVSLPSELVGHVDMLHPTTAFVTSDIFYGIPSTPATEQNNALLVTAYVNEWAKFTDIEKFLTLLRPDMAPNTTFTVLSIDDGTNPQGPLQAGDEANLDMQYTLGLATGVPIQFLSVGYPRTGLDFPQSLLDTITYLDGVADPPTVMTTSYGDVETSYGASAATKICNGYMALGARGISVIFASGDGGICGGHDFTPNDCPDNVFRPVFPASCPFVTSVGSTQGFGPEKAINFTGGGFSNFFPTADYQTDAVSKFLETIPTDFVGMFNRSGRGYPDVATQGWNFEMVWENDTWLDGGTSASAPTFASIIALINDRLISSGRPILGFLNPWLYSTASSTFTDVTIGHNSGLVRPASASGFDAAVGWDPLTGWGTPRFSDLLTAALA